jgi:O-antigen/teichoic acid export membrane protein
VSQTAIRLRRAGWSIADQAVSSLTNFVLAVLAARWLDPDDFGRFALVIAVYLLAVGLVRAVCGELLVVRFSGGPAREHAAAAFGATVLVALPISVAVAIAAVVAVDARAGLLALAVTLPALLLQDVLRYFFVADARPAAAFGNDMVWVAAQLGILGGLLLADAITLGSLVAGWGAAAAVAALAGLVQARCVPDLRGGRSWFVTNRGLWNRYATEFGATTGAWQTTLFVVGGLAGLVAAGALRGAQVLYGPLHVVYFGARLAVVPDGVRAGAGDGMAVRRSARRSSVRAGPRWNRSFCRSACSWWARRSWRAQSWGCGSSLPPARAWRRRCGVRAC